MLDEYGTPQPSRQKSAAAMLVDQMLGQSPAITGDAVDQVSDLSGKTPLDLISTLLGKRGKVPPDISPHTVTKWLPRFKWWAV
jgi:hypothetical protein